MVLLLSCGREKTDKGTTRMKVIQDRFQSIVDSMFQAVPNTKGIMMHIEAPDQGISWTGSAGWADAKQQKATDK